jgi:hypothetical protein
LLVDNSMPVSSQMPSMAASFRSLLPRAASVPNLIIRFKMFIFLYLASFCQKLVDTHPTRFLVTFPGMPAPEGCKDILSVTACYTPAMDGPRSTVPIASDGAWSTARGA